jgi:putative transposase
MVVLIGPGQAGDSPVFPLLLNQISVTRPGAGRPRTRPQRLRGDKAYSCRANRKLLRERGITTVIPERRDEIANRKRRGTRGGRPPAFDAADYKNRNTVQRSFNTTKQWRALATRYDKLALTYRGGAVLRAITIWLLE